MGLCQSHLSVESEAEDHFRNVCRALVSEALELSFFLEKTSTYEAEHSKELQELALKDWAHLWIQTMNELRHGVKLKKTNFTKTPIEYALTPYEMLMDNIRSRRYKLNKVMVDGQLPPKVKKDAHDVILEFIRSRPPLKPVSIDHMLLWYRYRVKKASRRIATVELRQNGSNDVREGQSFILEWYLPSGTWKLFIYF